MKFTSEDLMKAMGLQVGDRVIISDVTFEVLDNFELLRMTKKDICGIARPQFCISHLVDKDFEILPRPKKVGDMKCEELWCIECPLKILSHCGKSKGQKDTLYKLLNYWNNEYPNFDQEIYDLLKARLDKEVEE